MKRMTKDIWCSLFSAVLLLFLLSLLAASCSRRGNRFRLDGKLKNLNQGELYVYSPDGSMAGVDTIHIEKGRFVYETECDYPTTLHIIFPNYSVQPLFIEPGGSATMRGDATNLKELEIEGGDANDAMTAYRLQVAHAAPPDAARLTQKFITDHASSPVAIHLLRHHYIDTPKPDYRLAAQLLKTISTAQSHNPEVSALAESLKRIDDTSIGKALPAFSMPLLTGGVADKASLSQGKAVIMAFATWSSESMTMLRRLSYMLKNNEATFKLLAISLDGYGDEAKRLMNDDAFRGMYACPEKMLDDANVKALGISTVPDNIVVEDGRIANRSLPTDKLEQFLKGGRKE